MADLAGLWVAAGVVDCIRQLVLDVLWGLPRVSTCEGEEWKWCLPCPEQCRVQRTEWRGMRLLDVKNHRFESKLQPDAYPVPSRW